MLVMIIGTWQNDERDSTFEQFHERYSVTHTHVRGDILYFVDIK